MLLPEPADMYTLVVRTDYSDDLAWQAAVNAATAIYDAMTSTGSAPRCNRSSHPNWMA